MDILDVAAAGVTTMELRGRLDATSAPGLQARLAQLIDGGARRLVLDLSALDYANSLGLRVFLMAAKRLSPVGGHIAISGAQPSVERVFELTGFDKLFTMVATREDAARLVWDPGGHGSSARPQK